VPRLRQVPKSEAEAPIVTMMYDFLFEGRDPVAEPGTATGSPGDWWTVFALVPDVLEHAVQGFGLYQSPHRKLAPRLRELAQARAGWAAGSSFVFSQHCKSLRALGVDDAVIGAVPHWTAAECFEPTERLVLAYTDCLVLDRGRVPDGLFDALRAALSDEEILELTYIASLYLQHAVMSRALRTEFDDRDEPVVEVVVEGVDASRDVGRDIALPPR
jgi:alkylhydroperoxidase family enzyme